MALLTAIATAAAVVTAGVGAVAASESNQASRRARTRARAAVNERSIIQRQEERIATAQLKDRQTKQAAALSATVGRRSGRRSLISGSELGTKQQLG